MESPSAVRRAQVQELVFELLEREAAGESRDVLRAELLEREPELAPDLQRALGALSDSGFLAPRLETDFPERLGDFRLLRRLGAGGMGVVYLAHQESLGRDVALKLVRPAQLFFDDARARFQREVESAARLAHAGIAQVHTVGEAEGIPYFAQEYVPGASLDAVLAQLGERHPPSLRASDLGDALTRAAGATTSGETPALFRGTWVDACLEITRQLAEALQHAHERGVQHRDVKPSNVLLTPEGRVVLVDFGLAALAEGERLTRTGSQLGSLPYVPPERLDAAGESPGPLGDVYSLGVTLYELLTLRLPYDAPSVQRLCSLIAAGAPAPLRRANPAVSRDAGLVCATAMEPDPARRYGSAAAFRADLENVLARRPISIRPAGPILRARRWAQRHPGGAAALVLALLLVVGGPIGFGLQRARAAHDQGVLNAELADALRDEELQRARAEAHFERTLEAVEYLLRQIGDDGLQSTPQLERVRLEVVDRALELFESLEAERPDDARVRLERAVLRRSRGDVLTDLGRFEEALPEYAEHRALVESLLERSPDDAALQFALGQGLHQSARALAILGRNAQAAELYALSLARRPQLAIATSADVDALVHLSTTLRNRASCLRQVGALDEAAEDARESLAAARRAVDVAPDSDTSWRALGTAQLENGFSHGHFGRRQERRAYFETALGSLGRARELGPEEPRGDSAFATALGQAAELELGSNELELAEELSHRALERYERLAADFPLNPELVSGRRLVQVVLAQVCMRRGEHARGRELLGEIAYEEGAAARAAPEDDQAALRAAFSYANWSNAIWIDAALGESRFQRALEVAEVGLEHLQRLDLDELEPRRAACFLEYQRATAASLSNRPAQALEAIEAMEAHEVATAENEAYVADAWAEWGRAVERSSADAQEIEAALELSRERALDHLEAALDAGLEDPRFVDEGGAFVGWEGDARFDALRAELRRRGAQR